MWFWYHFVVALWPFWMYALSIRAYWFVPVGYR